MKKPPLSTALLGSVLLLMALLLSACSPGLAVDAYPTQPGTDVDCKALFADAPRSVVDEDAIEVEDPSVAVAWGAPPIIMRCGVAAPASYQPTSECYPEGDVCWYPEKTSDGFLFLATGRDFYVSVEVPADYTPYAAVLKDVAAAVRKHDPEKRV